MRRHREAFIEERRVDAAFEACAGIAGQQQFLAGAGDAIGVEIRAFDQHIGGGFGTTRRHAAHNAADVVHLMIIGDDGHGLVDGIGLAVQRHDLLAVARLAGDKCARQLGAIIDVQRPPEVEHDEIGDVDQCRNRLLPDGLELLLQPRRRRTIGDTRHGAAEEGRAARRIVGPHLWPGAAARNIETGNAIRLGKRLQPADAQRRQITRDAAHAHAILAVGGDRHVEHRVADAGIIGIARADRRIGGQLDDAVMFFGQLQLAHRAHHAVRRDAANGGDLERDAAARHIGARRAEHTLHAGAGIGGAADDLQRFSAAGRYRQDLQLVGLGMAFGSQHFGDGEGGEPGRRIVDAIDFEAQ